MDLFPTKTKYFIGSFNFCKYFRIFFFNFFFQLRARVLLLLEDINEHTNNPAVPEPRRQQRRPRRGGRDRNDFFNIVFQFFDSVLVLLFLALLFVNFLKSKE